MIGLPQAVKIRLFTETTDMRKGFDGLSALVTASGHDVYSGHLYVFLSRRRDRAKILTFAKGGFVLRYKRLERGRFRPLPVNARSGQVTLESREGEVADRLLGDARLPLDNNIAERALRIIALGRKNFLFAGHIEGAQNLAVLQSVVATCLLHGVNPYDYIKDLLIGIQHHPATELDALLPWNWAPFLPARRFADT